MALPRLRETIRSYMREHFRGSSDSCSEEKIECLLSDKELKMLRNHCPEYFYNIVEKNANRTDAMVESLCDEIEGRCIFGAKTFTHIFITTLLDKYFRPYFLEKYRDPQKVGWIIEFMKSAVTFSLVMSFFSVSLDVIIRNGLKSAMQATGFDDDYVDVVANRISSVIDFTENPLSLVEIGINDTAAEIGQKAAFVVIHKLPKLRYEPKPQAAEQPHQDNEQHRLEQLALKSHAGLRRRHH